MLKQTLSVHSLQPSSHVEGRNHLSEEDLEEELQIKDPGQDDVVENFADCAKPQAAGYLWRLFISHKVQDCYGQRLI